MAQQRLPTSRRALAAALWALLAAGPAAAAGFAPVEQERSFQRATSTWGDPPVVETWEATDFAPFTSPGHDSTLAPDALTGDLRATGFADGPHPEVESSASADFRVVFDLDERVTANLSATLTSRDIYEFGLGSAALTLSVFDPGLGDFQTLVEGAVSSEQSLSIAERFLELAAGRYQLEASAGGSGFWGSQDVDITGSGEVTFALAIPEPGTGLLAGVGLAAVAARRRATRRR